MSVNRNRPHVLILPEDDANRQIANGFHLETYSNQFQVLAECGGWIKVLHCFERDHVGQMERFPERLMILLIDLDGRNERYQSIKDKIPARIADRIFVLSTLTEPEELKGDLGSFEQIGRALAKDCREGKNQTWPHRLLQHNAEEVRRLNERVRPILFN